MAKEKPKYKVGQKVRFTCFSNQVQNGKIIKRGTKYLVETKERYYYFDKVTILDN